MSETRYPADRSERALQLVAEGKLGGPRAGSGRPRKIRPSELAAAAAVEHWDAIEKALVHGVENGTPEQRARTAARWVTLAQREDGHDLRSRRDDREADIVERMSIDQVHAEAANLLVKLVRTGRVSIDQLRAQLDEPDPVDAEVVESDD